MLDILAILVPLDSDKEGRFGDERVGLMDDGGVMELCEEVSIVEEDLPETISTLVEGDFESVALKLALDRRRSCLKKGIGIDARNFSPAEELGLGSDELCESEVEMEERVEAEELLASALSTQLRNKESATVCGVRVTRLGPAREPGAGVLIG